MFFAHHPMTRFYEYSKNKQTKKQRNKQANKQNFSFSDKKNIMVVE